MISLCRNGLHLLNVGKSRCGFLGQNTSVIVRCFSSAEIVTYDKENHEKAQSFTVSYLVNSRGFSPEIAKMLSKRVLLKSSEKPDSMICLLRRHGFTDAQVRKLVNKHPPVLTGNFEKTILPKFEFFRSVGISGADLAAIVSRHPVFLTRSLNKQLIPSYNFIKSLISDNAIIVKVLRRSRYFYDVQRRLEPNISALKGVGVSQARILSLLKNSPDILCRNPEEFNAHIKKAMDMGFDPLSMSFINALVTFGSSTEEAREQRMEVLRNWGLSEDELLYINKKNPRFGTMSVEKINGKMDFIVNKMGWKPSDVARFPAVLAYSLEKKIMPRCLVFKVLVSKGLYQGRSSLGTIVLVRDKSFVQTYVSKYKEEAPEIMDIYEGKVGLLELGF